MDYLIHHMLRASASRLSDKEAIIQGKHRLTYQEVAMQTARLANGLQQIGLHRGDRIGIYVEPTIAQPLSIFGISQAGGVFVPINPLLMADQVAHIAVDCQMKGLITTESRLQILRESLKNIPHLKFIVVIADKLSLDAPIPIYNFQELCQSMPDDVLHDVSIEKDLAAIVYTSGSTGKPKGVMLNHAQIMAGSSIVSTYLKITDADRILAILPFSFDAGLNQLMTSFQQGATLVMMTFVFARQIVEKLVDEQITALAGVPTLWNLLAQPNSSLQKREFPHLRYITNTGGAMSQHVLATLRQALPTTDIVLMYGLTEAFRSTYLPPEELDRRPTSMGKAIPNTEILVVNDQGQLCQPGEIGELVHRGPTVSMGYWGRPELTARVLRQHPFLPAELGSDEKVCYSGDLVKMDEEGFLYFVGRRDTMIKSSGFRISPTEVEEVLFQSGKIQGAAVIGVHDDMLGQVIMAFVVPRDGDELATDELIAWCADRLPRYMVPQTVEILQELPKTTSGKVDYPALSRRRER